MAGGAAGSASVLGAAWNALGTVGGTALAVVSALAVAVVTALVVVAVGRAVPRVAGRGGPARWAVVGGCAAVVWLGADVALRLLHAPDLLVSALAAVAIVALVGGALMAGALAVLEARARRRASRWAAGGGTPRAAG